MGKNDSIREKIMRVPTANDIAPEKLKHFLEHYGFELKHVNGSHFIYAYRGTDKNFILNIPMHKPVKPTYIDQVREKIIEIEGIMDETV